MEDVKEIISEDSDSEDNIYSVDFKCIGVTRDPMYQSVLSRVRDALDSGDTVPVKLVPEPQNPFDSNAIALKCLQDNIWEKFGYLVSEVCGEVLAAITNGDILSVDFTWVKFKVWKKSPGFYASITISKKGEWSRKVRASRSTFS